MSNGKTSLPQDFTRALNVSLRPGRIVVVALGLLIGAAAAMLFFWLGGLIRPEGLRWLSWIIQRIGAVIFAYVVLASMSSVVAMAHSESTGERIGVAAGWGMIARNLGPVVMGTMKPIVVFVGLIVLMWLAGLLGLIPEVGPILWSIISVIPLAAGLLGIFILVKLFLVSFVFPAVLCVTKQKGTTCYKESARFIKGHAVHILGRVAMAVLVCLVFYRVIVAGYAITASQSARMMGKNKATLRGSSLFEYLAGIPGVTGTSPRGFSVVNPTSPFVDASYTSQERYYVTTMLPSARPPFVDTAIGDQAYREVARRLKGLRMKATQKVGGWVFSVVLIVASSVVFTLPLLFFSLSGYYAYMSFKDSEEMPLRTEAVDWSEIKETAQEIAGKRKGEPAEKPAKGKSAKGG